MKAGWPEATVKEWGVKADKGAGIPEYEDVFAD